MGSVVLLSGVAGFLGSYIARELMEATDAQVYAPVRPRGAATPEERLVSLWADRPELA